MNKFLGALIVAGVNITFGYLSAAIADILFSEKEEKEE